MEEIEDVTEPEVVRGLTQEDGLIGASKSEEIRGYDSIVFS
jgi:hypothetical protein